jgi:hypothetical protein
MSYKIIPLILFTVISLVQGPASAQTSAAWPQVQKEMRPWTRWWWMGSAVDEKNLALQLNTFAKAGFGGVEIVPIYGAVGYEKSYIPYLSPQWMKMLDFTVKTAADKGMGVDMAVGTGWPIGGPQVTPQLAATKLVIQQYTLGAGESLSEKIEIKDEKQKSLPGVGLSALIGYSDDGKILDLTGKVTNGTLSWKPDSGKWQLYAAFTGKTRQMVKRAAPGGEGYTFDHFAKEPVSVYLHTFDSIFGATSHGVRSFFNDSYEVYNADWTPRFFEEFKQRRGYDLKPFLRELTGKDSSEKVGRIKSDYRETMSDLMLDNFTTIFSSWAKKKNAQAINQAHGSPGNLLDLYAAVDVPEAETFGSSYFPIPGLRRDSADVRNVDPDPNMLKFASSAAHAMGKKLVSNETFTWLTEHFKTSWSQCKPEVEQVFLAGINHVFYHGTTYSPAEVKWPGWLFYASVNFVPANSLWPHISGLNNYITRCQSVLQSGEPDNEVMIYWPVFDEWNNTHGLDKPFKVHDIDEWLHPTDFYKSLILLQQAGYSVDFVSDRMIGTSSVSNGILKTSAKGASHKVLVVPRCRIMPENTLRQILKLAENGATVIIQQLPEDVPGWNNLDSRRTAFKSMLGSFRFSDAANGVREMKTGKGRILQAADVKDALVYAGVQRETIADAGLKFIRRVNTDGKYYYLVNHTPKVIDTVLSIQTSAASVMIMDPQSGQTGLASIVPQGKATGVRLQIQPGEALILKTSSNKITSPLWTYIKPQGAEITLQQPWKVDFTEGGPVLPRDTTIQTLQSWTLFHDTAAHAFSGSASYTSQFNIDGKKAAEYLLNLGQVHESARVWINGQEVGILWSIPFTARVGKFLKSGQNTIRIEVANLMANRIRDTDRKKIKWRNYHEINFVNINYKDFDASNWKLQPSGLVGPVTITPMEIK